MPRHYPAAQKRGLSVRCEAFGDWRAPCSRSRVTITRAPLAAPITKDGTADPRSEAALERVRGLAKRARTASTYAERGMIYGELIATCAHCHTTTPRSP